VLTERDFAALSELIGSEASVFLPGASAEVPDLSARLFALEGRQIQIYASFVPGINPMPPADLPEGIRFHNPFGAARAGMQAGGQFAQVPTSYFGYANLLARCHFDISIMVVAPPVQGSLASLGAAVEFAPDAMRQARKKVVIVNHAMPSIPGAPSFDLRDADLVIETDAPLRGYDAGAPGTEAQAIAAGIAAFVEDGAALQIGIGKVPEALMRAIADRRNLRFHSGMLSDGFRDLLECGALDPAFTTTSCVHVGSAAHYAWLRDRQGVAVAPVSHTHAPATLAALQGLVAVNGAVSVDLFGQANLEQIGERAISGIGGAGDFAAAAARAADGISMIGLPCVGSKGQSRIETRLSGPVSLPRHDVEVIVTEHGSADLRGLDVLARAERIIAIAAPEHRALLAEEWREIAAKL